MHLGGTQRLYWQDDHCFEAEATVVSIHENGIAFEPASIRAAVAEA